MFLTMRKYRRSIAFTVYQGIKLNASESHTYIHTYIQPYIHTYIHTYIHPCIHACMHRNDDIAHFISENFLLIFSTTVGISASTPRWLPSPKPRG